MHRLSLSSFAVLSACAVAGAAVASIAAAIVGVSFSHLNHSEVLECAWGFIPFVIPSLLVYGIAALITRKRSIRLASFGAAYLPLAFLGALDIWLARSGRSADGELAFDIGLLILAGHTVCHAGAAFAILLHQRRVDRTSPSDATEQHLSEVRRPSTASSPPNRP